MFALLGLVAVLACGASGVLSKAPQVTISGTTFTGVSDVFNVTRYDFFGGLPFAEPPVGDLRFAPPVFKDTYDGADFNATRFGATCAQLSDSPNGFIGSEDCLTLNVFRPTGISHTANLPVFVYIYGGSFLGGDSMSIDASVMISQSVARNTPIVFVSINYRVGLFGFPQGSEAKRRGALNLGLKDQLVALQWINKHIATFGGNPHKVTIGGVSAGAMSASYLYFNSRLENLVHGAIFESGSPGSLPWFPPERRESAWNLVVKNVPTCPDLIPPEGDTFPCMRDATTAELFTALQNAVQQMPIPVVLSFSPVLDGPDGIMPDLPSNLSAQNKFAKIPFIAGTTLDEGTIFVPQIISTDLGLFVLILSQLCPGTLPSWELLGDILRLFRLYPDDGTGNQTFGLSDQYKRGSAIAGDLLFQAPRRRWMDVASAAGVRTWGYHFVDQSAVRDPSLGVAHGNDFTYFFGLEAANNSLGADVRLLSTAMLDYWLSFVTSGTPNDMKGVLRTHWPQYTPNNKVLIQLDRSEFPTPLDRANFPVVPDNYHEEQISFINSIQDDLSE